uniref:Uncharacterized protein n=1 Tax=Zea mays TaxID=4577 RepID=C4JA52_MAIZE|nr:unknown [Zea mays]
MPLPLQTVCSYTEEVEPVPSCRGGDEHMGRLQLELVVSSSRMRRRLRGQDLPFHVLSDDLRTEGGDHLLRAADLLDGRVVQVICRTGTISQHFLSILFRSQLTCEPANWGHDDEQPAFLGVCEAQVDLRAAQISNGHRDLIPAVWNFEAVRDDGAPANSVATGLVVWPAVRSPTCHFRQVQTSRGPSRRAGPGWPPDHGLQTQALRRQLLRKPTHASPPPLLHPPDLHAPLTGRAR